MARKPRTSTGGGRSRQKAATAAGNVARSNGLSPEVVKSITERWDGLAERLATAKGVYMKAAKDVAEDRAELLTEAKSKGINLKAFKTEIKCRDLGFKIAGLRGNLEGEDAEQAELLRDAITLLHTPVGSVGASAADKQASDAKLADSLTGDGDDDGDEAGEPETPDPFSGGADDEEDDE